MNQRLMPMAHHPIIVVVMFTLTACGGSSEPVVEIALHPTKPEILYVATNQYMYKTRDEGKTWENISRGVTHSRVISLAVDPLLSANVYAGTKGDAVLKSYNGGQNWTAKRNGLDDATITSVVHQLVFVPGSGQRLFAATSMGVFESENSGDSWVKRMEGMIEVLMVVTIDIDPNQPQTLYAGTTGGVYRSLDGAKTWTKINHGLVDPTILKSSRALSVVRVKIDPHRPKFVYAATLSGLYKTVDGGQSWFRIGETLPDQMLSDLVLDPNTPDTLYVSNREGIQKSMDGGQIWTSMNDGLTNLNIRAMVISPQVPQLLYVGTNLAGLFRTRNGGGFWEPIPLATSAESSNPT